MRPVCTFLAVALGLGTGCGSSQASSPCPNTPIEVELDVNNRQIAQRQSDLVWGPCPPVLPSACEMAVLEGDPRSETLFTVRFRTTEAFELSPHWHPRHERVTIFEGQVGVGFGDEVDREHVTWFGPGDYYVNAKGARHFVLTDGPALLQITGIGPWEVRYVDDE